MINSPAAMVDTSAYRTADLPRAVTARSKLPRKSKRRSKQDVGIRERTRSSGRRRPRAYTSVDDADTSSIASRASCGIRGSSIGHIWKATSVCWCSASVSPEFEQSTDDQRPARHGSRSASDDRLRTDEERSAFRLENPLDAAQRLVGGGSNGCDDASDPGGNALSRTSSSLRSSRMLLHTPLPFVSHT
jgi:hypothetical protein